MAVPFGERGPLMPKPPSQKPPRFHIATRLREVLKTHIEAGHTQAEIAEESGVERSIISRFLRGHAKGLSLDNGQQLARALGVTLGELEAGDPQEEKASGPRKVKRKSR